MGHIIQIEPSIITPQPWLLMYAKLQRPIPWATLQRHSHVYSIYQPRFLFFRGCSDADVDGRLFPVADAPKYVHLIGVLVARC